MAATPFSLITLLFSHSLPLGPVPLSFQTSVFGVPLPVCLFLSKRYFLIWSGLIGMLIYDVLKGDKLALTSLLLVIDYCVVDTGNYALSLILIDFMIP
jgi:hypothetical protein